MRIIRQDALHAIQHTQRQDPLQPLENNPRYPQLTQPDGQLFPASLPTVTKITPAAGLKPLNPAYQRNAELTKE